MWFAVAVPPVSAQTHCRNQNVWDFKKALGHIYHRWLNTSGAAVLKSNAFITLQWKFKTVAATEIRRDCEFSLKSDLVRFGHPLRLCVDDVKVSFSNK